MSVWSLPEATPNAEADPSQILYPPSPGPATPDLHDSDFGNVSTQREESLEQQSHDRHEVVTRGLLLGIPKLNCLLSAINFHKGLLRGSDVVPFWF